MKLFVVTLAIKFIFLPRLPKHIPTLLFMLLKLSLIVGAICLVPLLRCARSVQFYTMLHWCIRLDDRIW